MNNSDIHSKVTDSIIARIKAGIANGDTIAPWSKPWVSINGGEPLSGSTGKGYRGINWFILSMSGYSNPYWFTFNKVRALKGSVRKGEKGTTVVFWSFIEKIDKATGEKKKVAFLRYFSVFNAEQCDKLPTKFYPVKEEGRTFVPIATAEEIADKGLVPVTHGGGRAYYSPLSDRIQMPDKESFKGEAEYYSTLFHEMIHSTGHTSRLAREFGGSFGNERYAFEELVAEMGAAMLCATAGIESTVENSVSYLVNWMSKLQSNPDWLVKAAGKAQKAVDLILGRSYEVETVGEGDDSGEG